MPRFDRFPSPEMADEDGLVLVGGELAPDLVLAAYRQGIFPWPVEAESGSILAWWSPDPRAILEPDGLKCNRRLLRRIRSEKYRVTCDQAFAQVMQCCAEPRDNEPGTWITPEMLAVYGDLHRSGFAHSVETWLDDRLVGGIYGIALGGFFAGESMFYRERDASKIAVAYLIGHLHAQGYTLIDLQEINAHTRTLGATTLPRSLFLKRLATALSRPTQFGDQLSVSADDIVAKFS